MEYNSIKHWAEEDRPREKLLQRGCSALTDSELLTILIGNGTRNKSAMDLAKEIYQLADNNLQTLGKFTIDDFTKIKGVGNAKAITLIAAIELGRRRGTSSEKKLTSIKSSQCAYSHISPKISDLDHEELWAIYLNNKNTIIGEKQISIGGVSSTIGDVKIIVRHAISMLATGVILCHNHPSGSTIISQQDKELTQKTKEALNFIDSKLLDHIIVAHQNYVSFCDNGLL